MIDRQKHNYLITQLVKGVPLDKIDTKWEPEEVEEAQESYQIERRLDLT